MSFFAILPEELSALTGIRREAQLIYLKVIVPNRDRSTGIAKGRLPSAPFAVTYPDMQGALTVDGRQGVKGDRVDKSFCRRAVDELEREGLVKRLGESLFDGLECVIFNQYRALHFSAQNKPDTKSTPKADTKSTPFNTNNSITCDDVTANPDTGKTRKADTFTEYTDITGSSSQYSGNLERYGNNHAKTNLLTDYPPIISILETNPVQARYWQALQQTHVFSLNTLVKPNSQAEYGRMLALWERQGVDPERLPSLLKVIIDDLTSRGATAYSPMYFEQPVLRLAGVGNAKNNTHGGHGGYPESASDRLEREAERLGMFG